jgi:hypothetical protein
LLDLRTTSGDGAEDSNSTSPRIAIRPQNKQNSPKRQQGHGTISAKRYFIITGDGIKEIFGWFIVDSLPTFYTKQTASGCDPLAKQKERKGQISFDTDYPHLWQPAS